MISERRQPVEDVRRFGRFAEAALRYVKALGGWVCIGAALLAPGVARAAAPTPISSCQTISTAGFYALTGALSNTSGDCLVISASNVTVNLNSDNISSSGGSGAGIHILATVPPPPGCTSGSGGGGEDDLRGHSKTRNLCKTKPVENVFIEGQGATISGFAYGIEDDARRVTVDDVSVASDIDGIFLNGAHGGNFANFAADGNTVGVYVSGGGNSTFADFDASSNVQYGVWITGSNHNTVNLFTADNNGFGGPNTAGVFVGCSSTNPADSTCTDTSKNNLVFDNFSAGGNGYGIAVGLGVSANQVAFAVASSNTTNDLFDANSNCGTDLWFADFFSTSNNACIQ